MTTAIDRNIAARCQHARLRRHVDDPRRPQSILCRQRSGDELERVDESWIQCLAKNGNAFRNDDPVQSILQAIVLAADVELSE